MFAMKHSSRILKSSPKALPVAFLCLLMVSLLLVGCTGRDITRVGGWASALLQDNQIFVGTLNGEIMRLNTENGSVAWRYPDNKDGAGQFYGTPAADDQRVFVGSYDGKLYVLDRETGDQEWQQTTQGPIVGGVMLADGKAIIGSSDGNVYAYDVNDGTRVWDFAASDKVWSTPVVWDGKVYFGSLDHNMYAVSLADGTLVWKYETAGGIIARPLIVDGMVVIGGFDRYLYALDAATGAFKWRFQAGNWFWGGAVSDGAYIYAAALDKKLYALDMQGNLRWEFKAASDLVATPAVTPKGVLIATEKGRLHLVSTKDGREDWLYSIVGDEAVRSPLSSEESKVLLSTLKHSVLLVDVDKGRLVWKVSTEKK